MLTHLTFCLAFVCGLTTAANQQAIIAENALTAPDDQNPETLLGHPVRRSTTEEIEQAIRTLDYRPMLKGDLLQLEQGFQPDSDPQNQNDIIKANYQARLQNPYELSGEVQFEFSFKKTSRRKLGETNLQNLKFLRDQRELTLGRTTDQTIVLLVPSALQSVQGYWSRRGQQQPDSTVFDLQLPMAVLSRFELIASQDVLVTSPSSLVRNSGPVADGEQKANRWILYPPGNGRLIINCANRIRTSPASDRNISSTVDYIVRPDECRGRWNLNMPALPPESECSLKFSSGFTPLSVVGPGQRSFPFTWNPSEDSLVIENHSVNSLSSLVISGRFPAPKSKVSTLPVLTGGSWIDFSTRIKGKLDLSSGILRASFSPELTVQSASLNGLMETDVEFTADGSQRLTLEQFSGTASATFALLQPQPVLQEEIVTRATKEPGQVRVLIRINNRAGVAETIRYDVPREYRVTTVRELDTQLPLLFRIVPVDAASSTQPIEIFFRSPMPRDSRQLLELRLQSTSSEVSLRNAWLSNPNYLRLTDVVVLSPEQIPSGLKKTEGTKYSQFLTSHSWLPASSEDAVVFDRSKFPLNQRTQRESMEVAASIDHSVTVADNFIRESIQIQLTGTPRIPRELILQTADAADLNLKAEDERIGFTLQRNENSRDQNEWTLGIPESEAGSSTMVTLECEREVSGQDPPMFVEIPSATIASAGITLVNPNENWGIIDDEGTVITTTVSYPADPLETTFRIDAGNNNQQIRQVYGLATWLLDQKSDEVRASVLLQLTTFGFSEQLSLMLDAPITQPCLCLVNNHEVDVSVQDGRLDVLLPETQSDAEIQILIPNLVVQVDEVSRFQIPLVRIPNNARHTISTMIVPPTGQLIGASGHSSAARIGKPDEDSSDSSLPATSSADIQHFLARLAIRRQTTDSMLLSAKNDQQVVSLELRQQAAPLIRTVVIASCLLLILTLLLPAGPGAWVVTGTGILIAQVFGVLFAQPSVIPSILTAAFAAAGAFAYVRHRPSEHDGSPATSALSSTKSVFTGCLLAILFAPTIQADQPPPEILIPDDKSPLVFVPPGLLSPQLTSSVGSPPPMVVLDSHVEMKLLNKDSVATTITCHVAVETSVDQLFELPVQGVTLVECELDGQTILPVKSKSGQPSIRIASIPQPARLLDSQAPLIAASAAGWVTGLKVHKIQYKTRMVPSPDVLGPKVSIPLPPAPVTQFGVLDTTESATTADLLAPEPISGVRLGNEFNFPTLNNVSQIDVQLQFLRSEISQDQPPQASEIIARVLAVPNAVRINCECEIRPVNGTSESVRLPRLTNMNLVSAKTDTGATITPTVDKDFIKIPVPVDRQGLQKFQIEWQQALPLTTDISIDVEKLRQLNQIAADRFVLIVGTSDRFTIESIRTSQAALDPIPDSQRPTNLNTRSNEIAYLIPEPVQSVSVQLGRLLETREASLMQTAVVHANHIKWACQCELQIPDEPIFRQSVTVSQNLKIQSVSARSQDIDRVQSWYRDGNQLVVSLREATRGSLTLTLDGILPRQPHQDTALPVVALPNSVEVLEFSLELSADEPENVFIRSLEGTIPNSRFPIETMPVPVNPIRLTVTDELRPLIIRAAPQRAARATVVALLSDRDGQTGISIFMAFRAVESPFNLQFTKPTNVAYATSQVVSLPAEGSISSSTDAEQAIAVTANGSIDDNDLSVVVITGIVPAMTSDVLSLPLPTFDSPCTIESLSFLDGRDQNGVTAIPRWIRNLLPEIPDVNSPGNTNSLPVAMNESGDQIRVRLPLTVSEADDNSEDNRPAYTITTHRISGDERSVEGLSGILAFAPTAKAKLRISVPSTTSLVKVRLDGRPAPFLMMDNRQMIVTLNSRTSFVELDWLQPVPANNVLRASQLRLPSLPDSKDQDSIFIDRRLPLSHWRPGNTLAGQVDFQTLLTEITTGLQTIGTRPVSPASPTSPQTENQMTPLTGEPVWAELRKQSEKAADAYVRFMSQLAGDSTELNLVEISTTSPAIEIRQQLPLSTILTMLAAISMLLAGVTIRSKPTPTTGSSEVSPGGSGNSEIIRQGSNAESNRS